MEQHDARTAVVHAVVNLDIGGLERVVLNTIRLADNARFRHALICLENGGALLDELPDGVAVYPLNKANRLDPMLVWRIMRILKAERASILHCHNFGPLMYGAIAGRLAQLPVVYTAHGKYSARRLSRGWVRRVGRVDRIIAVSADAREVAVAEAGIAPEDVSTVINGVDTDMESPPNARDRVRGELNLEPDDMVFGIVARLTPVKDHSLLLRAFARVHKSIPEARLLIAGDGELSDTLQQEHRASGLGDAVRFLGARRDVTDLLSGMDAFVLSSYSEGLSITLLEAHAAALPIVATNVGGNTEVVVDQETGLIVPPRDEEALAGAMLWMAQNRGEAARMGERGHRRVVDRFSARAMVSQYQSVYQGLVAPE